MHPDIEKIEYSYITDGIYIGTNQCCQAHFNEALKKDGMTADISLEADRIDAPFGVDFYTWIPVIDKLAPSPDQLNFGVDALKNIVNMGKKVYVHCKNGHGRAPTLVAAYLIAAKGMDIKSAIEFIKSKRSTIHLQAEQLAILKDFTISIKKNGTRKAETRFCIGN